MANIQVGEACFLVLGDEAAHRLDHGGGLGIGGAAARRQPFGEAALHGAKCFARSPAGKLVGTGQFARDGEQCKPLADPVHLAAGFL